MPLPMCSLIFVFLQKRLKNFLSQVYRMLLETDDDIQLEGEDDRIAQRMACSGILHVSEGGSFGFISLVHR